MEHNANHIIPVYYHLAVSCRGLVDQCGSLGAVSHRLNLFFNLLGYSALTKNIFNY